MAVLKARGQTSLWSVIRRLWPYQMRFWLPFVVAVILLGANLFFDVGLGVIQQDFFARMHPGQIHQLLRLVWICGVIGIGLTGLNVVQHYCRGFATEYANRAFAFDVLAKINRLPFEQVQRFHSADLVSRVENDAGLVNNLLSSLIYDILYQILLGLVALVYLARINLVTAIVTVTVGPVLFALGRFFDGRIRRISENIQAQDAAVRAKVQESIQEIAAIRAFGLEDRTLQDFRSGKSAQNRQIVRRSVMQSAMWQLVMVAQGGVQVVSAVLIARNALHGHLSPGQVMTFVFLMSNVQTPFMRMSQVWNGIQQSLGAADRVERINGLPEEPGAVDGEPQSSLTRSEPGVPSAESAIVFDRVTFTPQSGPASSDKLLNAPVLAGSDATAPLFANLNLDIRAGETVALVGPSGSGKTSIARLACGLYQPQSGAVRVFGVSLQGHADAARQFLSYVPQSPYLFSGTIRDNIVFGATGTAKEDVEHAARLASVDEFVATLDNGYETVIGEQGYRLSGGQRQRIAIARAFLRNAPILILDEPTSALDNETERMIQAALEQLAHNKTVLVIAHRLSTIRNADRIVVLQDGRIVEQGTHRDLVARDGSYARLIALQTT